jgi:hypothetical protein
MTVIKPRTRGKHVVQHWTRLDQENRETLHAYAAFIGEDAEYVLNQVIETVLGKDKDFRKWRAQHPASFVPHPKPAKPRRTRGHVHGGGVAGSGVHGPMRAAAESA